VLATLMLTLVSGQVNSFSMVHAYQSHYPPPTAQQSLAAKLLEPLLQRRRPERVLVLKHAGAGDLPLLTAGPVQIIRLTDDETSGDAIVRCRVAALPFEQAGFELVVLHHLVGDGTEAVLAEALRVLSPGGDVVISGLNSSGLRYRLGNRDNGYPGIRLNRIYHQLKTRSFNIEQCLLMGLAGLPRPVPTATWGRLGVPFADRVVLHGHHQSNIHNANILRFKRIQAAGATSAVLDGCSSREAAS